MDLKRLEYALEIHRQKSFTKAAEKLHIAQPSLSKQIAKLEQELGVRLFSRERGSIEPTADGHLLIKHAERILLMRDDLKREMLERRDGIGGVLKLGSTAITGGHVLPALLQRFHRHYPQVRIELVEEPTEVLAEQTAKGLIDLSILTLPLEDDQLAWKVMLTEPLYLVLPAEETDWMPAYSSGQALTLQRVKDCPFIVLKRGYGFRRTVLELCASAGFEPQIMYETSSIETAQSLVESRLGLTIIPEMVRRQSDGKPTLQYIPISSEPTRTIVFSYQKDRYLSKNAKTFMEMFEQQQTALTFSKQIK